MFLIKNSLCSLYQGLQSKSVKQLKAQQYLLSGNICYSQFETSRDFLSGIDFDSNLATLGVPGKMASVSSTPTSYLGFHFQVLITRPFTFGFPSDLVQIALISLDNWTFLQNSKMAPRFHLNFRSEFSGHFLERGDTHSTPKIINCCPSVRLLLVYLQISSRSRQLHLIIWIFLRIPRWRPELT